MKRIVVPLVLALLVMSIGSYVRSLKLFDGSEPLDLLRKRLEIDRIPVDTEDDDPNSPIKGMTAAMKAAADGRLDVLELVVSKGADIDKKDRTFGYTPLMHAIVNNNQLQLVIVQYLINKARSHVGMRSMLGLRPVHLLLEVSKVDDRMAMMRLIMDKGGDINSQTDTGDTAMHLAVQRPAELNWIKFLMQVYGSQLNLSIKNKKGETPLDIANKLAYQDIAIALGGPSAYTR